MVLEYEINYWRTKAGHEVDFILEDGLIAIEVKISKQVHKSELKSLKAFIAEHKPKRSYIVSMDSSRRLIKTDEGEIDIIPVYEFLDLLWNGGVV